MERYGADEVNKWYWEVWNEPNISYWHGTAQDYFKLYDYAVDGVRRALPTARVGGPETAGGPGGNFLRRISGPLRARHELCDRQNRFAAGLHFVSRERLDQVHGRPCPHGHGEPVAEHERRLRRRRLIPRIQKTPLVIGESDPEGCAACTRPQDGYRNGTMYSSYTAASFPREFELAEKHGVNLQGALTWAFEFEDQPPFAGFRAARQRRD